MASGYDATFFVEEKLADSFFVPFEIFLVTSRVYSYPHPPSCSSIFRKSYVIVRVPISFKPGCHIPFTHAVTALQCIFEELTLLVVIKPFKPGCHIPFTHALSALRSFKMHNDTLTSYLIVLRCNFEEFILITRYKQGKLFKNAT